MINKIIKSGNDNEKQKTTMDLTINIYPIEFVEDKTPMERRSKKDDETEAGE